MSYTLEKVLVSKDLSTLTFPPIDVNSLLFRSNHSSINNKQQYMVTPNVLRPPTNKKEDSTITIPIMKKNRSLSEVAVKEEDTTANKVNNFFDIVFSDSDVNDSFDYCEKVLN